MKKFCLSLCMLLLICSSLMAQRSFETIYLNNGSMIKGEVIEQIPGQSVKIRTRDGSILVHSMSEVEKITKENKNELMNSGHHGLDFSVDLGYNITTKKGGSGAFSTEIGIGKRFNKNFYWGIGGGTFISSNGGHVSIPLTSDFRVYFPLNSSSLMPYGSIRMGYVFTTGQESIDQIMLQITPGVRIPLSQKVGFNLALGYTHFFPTEGIGEGSGAFTVKTGFDFNQVSLVRSVPTRDKGLQVTLEGNTENPWKYSTDTEEEGKGGYSSFGGAIVFTYKTTPTLSFGVGYGVDAFRVFCKKEEEGIFSEYGWAEGTAHNVFLRGQYRLNNNKLSPFAACDVGIRKYNYSHDDLYRSESSLIDFNDAEPKRSSAYLAPALGASLRVTNNSYLECKLGYTIASKLSDQTAYYEDRRGNTHSTTYKSTSLSALFFKIGFTHTFSLLSQ